MSTFLQTYSHFPRPALLLALLIGIAETTLFGAAGLANPSAFLTGYGLPLPSPKPAHPGAIAPEIETEEPSSTSTNTSVPPSKPDDERTQQHQRTITALTAALAARNIQNGILILTFGALLRDRRALGVVMSAGVLATVADCLVVRRFGVKEAVWGHLVGVVNSVGLGGALLWAGRV
ncbi:hypothetical protein K402DRAFT_459406 [Aulographum hederae CBS 113979]|uniref:DUF4267 domain-containing protein n=1 Tax=Aulographum hederae CBS 113979 TaxID=1176131 RepID=A0A6G1HEE5_9PEZI|nr:hypothetical protein K402DRAFT_459406 [Aulographum hederae CBS 113979]